jgi:AcrR family transcriptional regulator
MEQPPTDDVPPRPRRGRPRSTRTPAAIRAAAERLFARQGFSATSVKAIAAEAGVDAALVIRHFGSKEALFLETMAVDQGDRGLTEGPIDTLGAALIRRLVVDLTGTAAGMFAALVGSADRGDVREHLDRSSTRHVVEPLARRLSGPEPELRARLVLAQITGLQVALWVVRDPGLVGRSPEQIVALYAPAVQALIDGPAAA